METITAPQLVRAGPADPLAYADDLAFHADLMDIINSYQWRGFYAAREKLALLLPDADNFTAHPSALNCPPFVTFRWRGFNILLVAGIQAAYHGLHVWADWQGSISYQSVRGSPRVVPYYLSLACKSIFAVTDSYADYRLPWIMLGHSWGGMITTAFAHLLMGDDATDRPRILNVTACSPRSVIPGYRELQDRKGYFDSDYRVVRYINNADLVPSLPPRKIWWVVDRDTVIRQPIPGAEGFPVLTSAVILFTKGSFNFLKLTPPSTVDSYGVTPFKGNTIALIVSAGAYNLFPIITELFPVIKQAMFSALWVAAVQGEDLGVAAKLSSGWLTVPPGLDANDVVQALQWNPEYMHTWRHPTIASVVTTTISPLTKAWERYSDESVDVDHLISFMTPAPEGSSHQMGAIIAALRYNVLQQLQTQGTADAIARLANGENSPEFIRYCRALGVYAGPVVQQNQPSELGFTAQQSPATVIAAFAANLVALPTPMAFIPATPQPLSRQENLSWQSHRGKRRTRKRRIRA